VHKTAWKIGLMCCHAAALPPGINEGPVSAPSSPPDTPEPTYNMPAASTCFVRRIVSVNRLLPPSIRMSPLVQQRQQVVDHCVDGADRP
jgi:hypothetical protein